MTSIQANKPINGDFKVQQHQRTPINQPDDNSPQYNATDLGTSGAYLPGMYTGNAMEKARQNLAKQEGKIAVIDNNETLLDWDYDGQEDFSHLELVSSFASETPFTKEDIVMIEAEGTTESLKQLEIIRKKAEDAKQSGKDFNITVINLSHNYPQAPFYGYGFGLDELQEFSGITTELTPENIKEMAPEVIEGLRKNIEKESSSKRAKEIDLINTKADELWKNNGSLKEYSRLKKQVKLHNEILSTGQNILKVYDEIDKLSDLGITTVIAAGNHNQDEINSKRNPSPDDKGPVINGLTLNEKAIVVGSKDDYSYNNSLVDIYTDDGVFGVNDLPANIPGQLSRIKGKIDKGKNLQEIKKEENPSITNDPHINISDVKTINQKGQTVIIGTSFSAPEVAKKYVKPLASKGLSTQEINTLFQKASIIAQQQNISSEKALERLIQNIK